MQRGSADLTRTTFADQWRAGVGIVAHESAHTEALFLVEQYMWVASRCRLVMSPGLGLLCGSRLELAARFTTAGVQQSAEDVAALVSNEELDAVVYLANPLANPRWDAALRTLVRACNARNVPLATNAATARAVLAELGARLLRAAEETVTRGRKEDSFDNRNHGNPGAAEEAAAAAAAASDTGATVLAQDKVASAAVASMFPLRGELGLD